MRSPRTATREKPLFTAAREEPLFNAARESPIKTQRGGRGERVKERKRGEERRKERKKELQAEFKKNQRAGGRGEQVEHGGPLGQ